MKRKPRSNCPICATKMENLRSKYCSNICQLEAQYRNYIERWKLGLVSGNKGRGRYLHVSNHVRRYLIEKFGERCTTCGWAIKHPADNRVPLNVEHIDGDPFNSVESNLTLLCPNCHSLTLTYGGRNMGRGRDRLGP